MEVGSRKVYILSGAGHLGKTQRGPVEKTLICFIEAGEKAFLLDFFLVCVMEMFMLPTL